MNSIITNPESTKSRLLGAPTRQFRTACLLTAAALLLAPDLRAQSAAPKPAAEEEDAQPQAHSVRLKFVPAEPARSNGASWSRLRHFPDDDPDVLMLMANAGIGDSFPVQEKDNPKVMDVKIVSGNDDELELGFAPTEKPYPNDSVPKTMKVRRNDTASIVLQGYRYKFSYPTVNVASDGKTTTDTPMLIVNRIPLNSAFATSSPTGTLLYSLRFSDQYNDGRPGALGSSLVIAFPRDNIVMSPSAENVQLPSFEVRNMKLKELAKTIEFLSEGKLTVEVVEKEGDIPGNIWRIGGKTSAATATPVKSRSIAAPHLFADKKRLISFMDCAEHLGQLQQDLARRTARVGSGGATAFLETVITTLSDQETFVIIGSEDGVAGMESLVKAAEQRAADEDAAKEAQVASLAPKMHAVAAPHLFVGTDRFNRFMKDAELMVEMWESKKQHIAKEAGLKEPSLGIIRFEPRREQKVFVLFGSEESIAGMESLIKAAEQIAADEDAKDLVMKLAEDARVAQERAKREADRKYDEEAYPKGKKREP